MADAWWSLAVRDGRAWSSGTFSKNTSSRRCVLHDTENDVGASPRGVADYMWSNVGASTGYHIILPLEAGHRPLQLRPLTGSAGGLRNNGSLRVSPNKQGTVIVQVALVCWAKDSKATVPGALGPWWGDLLTYLDSWDVPRVVFGGLPAGGGVANKMSLDTWYSPQSGWSFHATTPNPDSVHWDPGRVDPAVLFAGQGGTGDWARIDGTDDDMTDAQFAALLAEQTATRQLVETLVLEAVASRNLLEEIARSEDEPGR